MRHANKRHAGGVASAMRNLEKLREQMEQEKQEAFNARLAAGIEKHYQHVQHCLTVIDMRRGMVKQVTARIKAELAYNPLHKIARY